MTSSRPAQSTVARLGGDEFAIILPGSAPPADTETLLRSLIREISAPFSLDMDRVFVSGSVGIAVFPEAKTPEQLALMESMGCNFAQGFLFSTAVTARELEALLA
nr:diguanylate cyclase [Massilia cavernae]